MNKCPKCQNFFYNSIPNNQRGEKNICSECGTITFLTFRHAQKEPSELLILTKKQYQDLLTNTQQLNQPEVKQHIQQVLAEIERDNR
jgi:hypothetical protein